MPPFAAVFWPGISQGGHRSCGPLRRTQKGLCESIGSQGPSFLGIRLAPALHSSFWQNQVEKENDHVLADVHHSGQRIGVHGVGARFCDQSAETRETITRAEG